MKLMKEVESVEEIHALMAECKGRCGQENESSMAFDGWNPGYVEFSTSYLSHAAKILQRAGSAVTHYHAGRDEDGRLQVLTLRIPNKHPVTGASVVRGFEFMITPVDLKRKWPGTKVSDEDSGD